MADREVTVERTQVVLFEDLADEPERALRNDEATVVGGGNPGRFLATVLERVKREVGEPRDLLAWGIDAEDAALIAGSIALIKRGLLGHESRPVAIRGRVRKEYHRGPQKRPYFLPSIIGKPTPMRGAAGAARRARAQSSLNLDQSPAARRRPCRSLSPSSVRQAAPAPSHGRSR